MKPARRPRQLIAFTCVLPERSGHGPHENPALRRHLWKRTIGSALTAKPADSLLSPPSLFGIWPRHTVSHPVELPFKTAHEIAATPSPISSSTVWKRTEGSDPYDTHTSFSPSASTPHETPRHQNTPGLRPPPSPATHPPPTTWTSLNPPAAPPKLLTTASYSSTGRHLDGPPQTPDPRRSRHPPTAPTTPKRQTPTPSSASSDTPAFLVADKPRTSYHRRKILETRLRAPLNHPARALPTASTRHHRLRPIRQKRTHLPSPHRPIRSRPRPQTLPRPHRRPPPQPQMTITTPIDHLLPSPPPPGLHAKQAPRSAHVTITIETAALIKSASTCTNSAPPSLATANTSAPATPTSPPSPGKCSTPPSYASPTPTPANPSPPPPPSPATSATGCATSTSPNPPLRSPPRSPVAP